LDGANIEALPSIPAGAGLMFALLLAPTTPLEAMRQMYGLLILANKRMPFTPRFVDFMSLSLTSAAPPAAPAKLQMLRPDNQSLSQE